MDILKLLLIPLGAVIASCIAGVVLGKHLLKKQRGEIKPILSLQQRLIFGGSMVLGLACVLFALLYNPASAGDMEEDWTGEEGWDDVPVFGGDWDDGEYDDPMAMDGGMALEDGAVWDEDGELPEAGPDPDMDADMDVQDNPGTEALDAGEEDTEEPQADVAQAGGGVAVAQPRRSSGVGGGVVVEYEVRIG